MKKIISIVILLIFIVSCSTPMRVLYLDIKDDQGDRIKDITMMDAEQKKKDKFKFYQHSWSHEDMKKDTLKFYIPKKERVELKLYELNRKYSGECSL